jgi:glucose uptake protein GlcU
VSVLVGLLIALACAVLFGLYMAPRKLCTMRSIPFLLSMVVGVIMALAVAWQIGGRPMVAHGADRWLSLLTGSLWSLGTLFFVLGVSRLGLAVATTIKNTTAVWGALAGIVLFGEGAHTEPVTCIVGSALIALSAGALGRIGAQRDAEQGISVPGVVFSLLASLAYAAYTIPMKVVHNHGVSYLEVTFLMGFGAALTALLIFAAVDRRFGEWMRLPWREHALAMLAGIIWSAAVLTMTAAFDMVGLAVTWPIANVNTVFAVALGVWVFREIEMKRHGRMLWLGLCSAVLGVGLLGLSKVLRAGG